jgi:hypothetical protein
MAVHVIRAARRASSRPPEMRALHGIGSVIIYQVFTVDPLAALSQ